MPRYVALLRAVNVGGVTVPMADLRRVFEELGFADVTTYIQSGNVVFSAGRPSVAGIESAIAAGLGLPITVVVRSAAQLRAVVDGNPFAGRGIEPAVVFLASTPPADRAARLEVPAGEPEEFALRGADVFVHYPNGMGRSKFTNAFIERRLGVAATTRNWRTVAKLLEMASAQPST